MGTIPTFGISKAQQAVVTLVFQCRVARVPAPQTEYVFAPPRRWRFDLAWPEAWLAVEIEGLVFPPKPRWHEPTEHRLNGRHVSIRGYLADLEKYNEAFALGWSLLRVTHRQIDQGTALRWLERRFYMTTPSAEQNILTNRDYTQL